MKKRTKESKKRINSLILLIAFTMILMITSTYAWFSTQKDITLSNIKGTVNVAEGLEVSLDGLNWTNEITNMDESLKKLGKAGNDEFTLLPPELIPVSCAGEATNKDLTMLRGKVTKKTELSDVIEVSKQYNSEATEASGNKPEDKDFSGYIAFNMYLKNTNKKGEDTILQLNKNSIVSATGKASGLQNSVRVAFAKYTNTVDPLAEQKDILALGQTINDVVGEFDYGNIADVAIWEPNSKSHVPYVVTNNNFTKEHFTDNMNVPTFGLLSTAKDVIKEGQKIANIYDPSAEENTNTEQLKEQVTVKTNMPTLADAELAIPEGENKEGVQNLLSAIKTVDSLEKGTAKPDTFKISPNKITRVKVYIWLEGGDVDCINYASHGQGIDVQIGLIKDAVEGRQKVEPSQP